MSSHIGGEKKVYKPLSYVTVFGKKKTTRVDALPRVFGVTCDCVCVNGGMAKLSKLERSSEESAAGAHVERSYDKTNSVRLRAPVNMQCKQRCAQVENMLVSSDNQVKMSPFLPLRCGGELEQSVLAPLTHRGPHSYSGLYNWPKKD